MEGTTVPAKFVPPPGTELKCDPEHLPLFLEIIGTAFSRPGFRFRATEEYVSAICGFSSDIITLIWLKYGGWLAIHGVKPLHLLWMLSRLKLYIPWTALGPMWGSGKTVFRERALHCQVVLLGAMNEVRPLNR